MRLFIAIETSAEILKDLVEIQRKINMRGISVSSHPHLTLKFLGEAEPEKIIEKLKAISFTKFELTITEIGFFPNVSSPRVIYAGINDSTELIDLQNKINESTSEIKQDHPFKGHMTLARVKFYKNKAAMKAKINSVKLKRLKFPVTEFKLKRSELKPTGPQYTDLAIFPAKDL